MRPSIRARLKAIPGAPKAVQALRYARFQIDLRRAEAADRIAVPPVQGVPLPPARLRHRVHGDLDPERFLQVGAAVADDLRRLVALSGSEWPAFSDVLDFGCGAARVMRCFLGGTARLSGTDIDPDLVNWCQRHLSGVDCRLNPLLPPSTFADGAFDLVYAVSVFTHLDEPLQNAWLAELRRITRPGAVLVLTLHGEPVLSQTSLSSVERRLLQERGFLFSTGVTGRLKLDGLPDFYQTAYHTTGYVQEVWGRFFEIIAHVPAAINHHQDGVVLRRL